MLRMFEENLLLIFHEVRETLYCRQWGRDYCYSRTLNILSAYKKFRGMLREVNATSME